MTDARVGAFRVRVLQQNASDVRLRTGVVALRVLRSRNVYVPPPPPAEPAASWWDGDSLEPATVLGWWDGDSIEPVEAIGYWDGATIQPLEG